MAGWKGLEKMLDAKTTEMRQIACEESVGKTVAGFARGTDTGPLLFTFTDGTFMLITLLRAFESCDDTLDDTCAFDRRDFYNDDKMVELGMLTAADMEAIKLEQDTRAARAAKQTERDERSELLRLKRKYEPKD